MRWGAGEARGRPEHKYSAAVIQGWGAPAVLTLLSPMAGHQPGPGSSMGLADPPPRPPRAGHTGWGKCAQRDTGAISPAPPGGTARGGYRKGRGSSAGSGLWLTAQRSAWPVPGRRRPIGPAWYFST